MGKFRILKADKIIPNEFAIKEPLGDFIQNRIDAFIKENGQHQAVVVAQSGDNFKIIDGNKLFKTLTQLGFEDIVCFDLGKLEEKEDISMRLLLNANITRIDYISIAELISTSSESKQDLNNISIKTGMPLTDVERYNELLKFDWDAFSKLQINQQVNFFDDER